MSKPTIRIVADEPGGLPPTPDAWPEPVLKRLDAAKARIEKAHGVTLLIKTRETRYRTGTNGVVSYEYVLEQAGNE